MVAYDGNLRQEFRTILNMFLDSLNEDNFDAYTCKVSENVRYECLDVASSSTLGGSLYYISNQSSIYSGSTIDSYAIANSSISSTSLWGSSSTCFDNKRVGDGMINSYDLWVYAMSYFRLAPYDNVDFYTTTVNGRDDTRLRCGMNMTSSEWILGMSNDLCSTNDDVQGRRLSTSTDLNVSVSIESSGFVQGRWIRIHIPHVFWAIELHLEHISVDSYVPLTHTPVDTTSLPANPTNIEIRYKRHLENERRCAMIISSIYGNIAMVKNSIQIAQYGNNPCACDLYMWIPQQFNQPIAVSQTSTAMNGFGGARQFTRAEERAIVETFEARLVADPHLQFAHGGRADIRGKHMGVYNLLSSYKFSLNIKFENSTITLRDKIVYGSFVTSAYIRADSTQRLQISFNAFQNMLGAYAIGRCDNRRFILRSYQMKTCGDVHLLMNYSSLSLQTPEWNIAIQPKPIYDRIDGPFKRLDISISNSISQFNFRHTPHGLLGQSFDSDHMAVFGLIESFDTTPYRTRYMAEGAIEGRASDYEMANEFSTDFAYSRFDVNGQTRSLQNLEGFILNVIDHV